MKVFAVKNEENNLSQNNLHVFYTLKPSEHESQIVQAKGNVNEQSARFSYVSLARGT